MVNIRGSLDFFNKSIASRVKINGESKFISNSVSIDSTLLSSNLSAKVLAGYLSDQLTNPAQAAAFDKKIMGKNPDLTGGIKFVKSARHEGYVDASAIKKEFDRILKSMGWLKKIAA